MKVMTFLGPGSWSGGSNVADVTPDAAPGLEGGQTTTPSGT